MAESTVAVIVRIRGSDETYTGGARGSISFSPAPQNHIVADDADGADTANTAGKIRAIGSFGGIRVSMVSPAAP